MTDNEIIESRIFLVRGSKVMLSTHLAELYQVEPKVLMQAVKRNGKRFPGDFMFQLTWEEANLLKSKNWPLNNPSGIDLRSQIVTLKKQSKTDSRSQIVTLNKGNNIKYLPYAFTEQGVAMLSSVLRSDRAIHVNIEIIRAFVRLRQMLASHADLADQLAALEKKYDTQFKVVFDALRELMKPPDSPKNQRIGFKPAPSTTI
jgi:hypothetical protein